MKYIKRLLTILIILSAFKTTVFADQEMSLDVGTGVRYIGHEFDIYPQINLGGEQIDTISMRNLNFDTGKVSFVSNSILNLFSSQVVLLNSHDDSTGTVRIDMGKNANTANYSNNSWAHFAKITYLAKNTGNGANGVCTSENGYTDCKAHFFVDYDGTPSKSGVFLGGVNTLDRVYNADVVLQEDDTLPIWSNCSPSWHENDVPVNSNVFCSVVDNETDIYLPETFIELKDSLGFDDFTFRSWGSTTYSTSRILNGYRIIVNPTYNFPYDSDIVVFGSAQDNAYDNGPVLDRNTGDFNTSNLPYPYTFHTEKDVDAPSIYDLSPANEERNVSSNTNIQFKIHDLNKNGGYPGIGVDLASLKVTVSADNWGTQIYTAQSTALNATVLARNTPYQNPYDYSISIDPNEDFPENTWVTVKVEVNDLSNSKNHLSTEYKFLTADTISPTCYMFSPEPGATILSSNTAITFRCIDTGVGIDINSVTVQVDGIVYTNNGLNKFVVSGDPSSYDFTIKAPESGWQDKKAFEVIINGADFSNNYMEEVDFGLSRGLGDCECVQVPCTPEEITNTIIKNIPSVVYQDNNKIIGTSDLGKVSLLKINNDTDIKRVYISNDQVKIVIEGTAKPNSFLTLMIKSEPLFFTTKTDSQGKWKLVLLNVFPIGHHDIFAVSINNDTGIIENQHFLGSFNIYNSSALFLGRINSISFLITYLWIILLILFAILVILYIKYKREIHNLRILLKKKDL
jgi:hypothetical protein